MNFAISFPVAVLSQYFFGTVIFILSLFMVLLILVQRGKGGGLTGALGGPGGQSAFGTKAGDLFTRITVVAAACWIFLLAFCTWWYTESDFTAALGDDVVSGAGQMAPSPNAGAGGLVNPPAGQPLPPSPGTTDGAAAPVAPAGDVPSTPSTKASGEVEAGDMPKSAGKEDGKSEAPPPPSTDSTKGDDAAKTPPAPTENSSKKEPASTEPLKTEPPKTETPESDSPKTDGTKPDAPAPSAGEPTTPAKPPELAPPEPAAGEPKPNAEK